ncbi:MAG: hypothetical protein ACD_26C00043G0002 [uncultured bacterium]|nr:MAG: hypothetical protein ACD_26C00043G0002 [uncultured bacterium]
MDILKHKRRRCHLINLNKLDKEKEKGKKMYRLMMITVGLVFIMDCFAIALYYPNISNIVFVLTIYPVIIFFDKKHNLAYVKLITELENKKDIYKQYCKSLALHLSLVLSTFAFIKYSIDSVSTAMILFVISIGFQYVLTYLVLSSLSFIYSE